MTTKPFGCVEMKNEIQRRLQREYGHIDWSERNRRIHEQIRKDPHLVKLLQADGGRTLPKAPSD